MQKYMIVHIYWGTLSLQVNPTHYRLSMHRNYYRFTICSLAMHWFRDMKEVATSVLSPGCMDLPIDAGLWLKHFKSQNSKLLSQLDVRLFRDVTLLAILISYICFYS